MIAQWCAKSCAGECFENGTYEVVVDTELFDGSLTFGELMIAGDTDQEIFIPTYIYYP